jgi:hypothetical protein
VAGAFAGFAQVIETMGSAVLPEAVRRVVSERINAWSGETMPISRRWVDEIIDSLRPEHQAAARLALLTALASYQVDTRIIEDFRLHYPENSQLIAVTAWASWTAARRVGSWLQSPVNHKATAAVFE